MKTTTQNWSPSKTYYECGICDQYHPVEWDGDCREDASRFFADELDRRHGFSGWRIVPTPE